MYQAYINLSNALSNKDSYHFFFFIRRPLSFLLEIHNKEPQDLVEQVLS